MSLIYVRSQKVEPEKKKKKQGMKTWKRETQQTTSFSDKRPVLAKHQSSIQIP